MTQLLGFDELPIGSQISIATTDRGVLSGAAVSPTAIGSLVTTLNEVKVVSKAGNDVTADGSIGLPFLTVQAAINSISDASTAKPYVIWVLPGVYITSFTLAPSIFVVGSGPRVTFLSPAAANCLAAGFAGAGLKVGGMSDATLSTALKVDFAAIGSTGAGSMNFSDLEFLAACSLTGVTSTNYVCLRNVFWENINGFGANLSITDMAAVDLFNVAAGFGNITIVGHDSYFQEVNGQGVSLFGTLTETWTGATASNALDCFFDSPPNSSTSGTGGFGQPVVTGLGAIYACPSGVCFNTFGANFEIQFNRFAGSGSAGGVGAVNGVDLGINHIIVGGLVADITATIRRPTNGTRVCIKNQSAFAIILDFGALGVTGDPSYIGPFGYAEAFFSSGTWMVESQQQSGTGVLVNGVSALIPADISAKSRPIAQASNLNGSAGIGVLVCLDADKVNGTRAGGGGFVVRSLSLAGAPVVADQSTFNWTVSPGKA